MSRPVTVSRPLAVRMLLALTRPARRWFYAWRLECIVDELLGYMQSGTVIGPEYRANCEQQMRHFRSRLAMLDLE